VSIWDAGDGLGGCSALLVATDAAALDQRLDSRAGPPTRATAAVTVAPTTCSKRFAAGECANWPTARAVLEYTPQIAGLSCGCCGDGHRRLRLVLPEQRTALRRRMMKAKLDTMALISAAIAVAIWVLVIWTAIAAIVAHI